jgi:hypothetical protein
MTTPVSLKSSSQVAKRRNNSDSTYLWRVECGGKTYDINADLHLPCIPAVDPDNQGEVVATITKIGLPDGEVKYGPADVYEGQVQAWISALQ